MKEFSIPQWQEILRHNQLDGFDALWELKADWFEPPNQRRGGWSGVVRIELNLPDGGTEAVFVKRQENHTRRTLRHPLRGEPTITSEIRNILALQAAEVPTLEPIFFGERLVGGNRRAILVTRELRGFRPLDLVMQGWLQNGWSDHVLERRELLLVAARVLRKMHSHRLVHNALHPKHLFVRLHECAQPEVRLIDLEKMRRAVTPARAARRDLDSLNRRAGVWSQSDRLRFLEAYLETDRLSGEGRSLWAWLAHRRAVFLRKHINHG
ncbi:MAG: hypothetical protein GY814_17190 [Gammaproteobacteria bacterium]|nr:hypothetical protein [Gammaproteobacteria bacterium]